MYNKKDIPELEKNIKAVIGDDGQARDDAGQKVIDKYTGPGIGLIWDEKEKALHLADGWIYDGDGNIVNQDDVTGPGVQ